MVIDEIHERDLNTDFLLVVLRDIVHEFPDVRIVLMSATIDTSTFSNYFSNAPVIEVSGRTFPVNQVSFRADCETTTSDWSRAITNEHQIENTIFSIFSKTLSKFSIFDLLSISVIVNEKRTKTKMTMTMVTTRDKMVY